MPNADFVIEGYVDSRAPLGISGDYCQKTPRRRIQRREPLRNEGPFGDHTGGYTLPEPYPVFHVTAFTQRKDAVYPATIVGIPPMEGFLNQSTLWAWLGDFKAQIPRQRPVARGE